MEAGEGKEADVGEVMEADVMKFAEATDGKAAGEGRAWWRGRRRAPRMPAGGRALRPKSSVQCRAWPAGARAWWRAWWRAQRMPARERASLI